jgi:5-methylthioadenosine/S-adenosylhomocysteine deaminase
MRHMGKTLLKGGAILSMDPAIGTLRQGDLLIEGQRIVDIQDVIDADDCEVFDASGMVVMPGLIDGHRHLWYAGIRGANMDSTLVDIGAAHWGQLGPAFTPDDVYAFTRAGIAECLDNGITTVFDWCHVINSPAHAEAAVKAHRSGGMRAVFGYGGSMLTKVQEMAGEGVASQWDHAAELARRGLDEDAGRLTLALALPGLDYASLEDTIRDVSTARELGLSMSFHVGGPEGAPPKESIRGMAEAGLLGPDMSFVHCCDTTVEEIELAVAAGAHLMTCPAGDTALGIGSSPTPRMRRHGVRPVFGTDSVLATSGDLFEGARVGLLLDRYEDALKTFAEGTPLGTHESQEGRMTARQALEAITSAAAACCWLDDEVGTLAPGKQADIILLRATDLNLWPLSNLESALLAGARGSNVDTVFVAGEVVKRGGTLVGVDVDAIRDDLVVARDRLYAACDFDDINPKLLKENA